MGKVDFDGSLDAGAGAFEVAEALELIADKLVGGRALQRQKSLGEGVNFRRPRSVMVAATRAGLEGFWINEPGGAKLVKAGFADSEEAGEGGGIRAARVKIRKDAQDDIRGEAGRVAYAASLWPLRPASSEVPGMRKPKERVLVQNRIPLLFRPRHEKEALCFRLPVAK